MSRGGRKALGYVGATLVLLLGWHALALALDSPALPSPAEALPAFIGLLPDLWPHTLISLYRVLAALAAGTMLAVPLGLAIGRSRVADALFAPLIFMTYPVPKVVFLPILLIFFGLGNASKIVLLGLIVFFQVLVSARDAARSVPENAILSVRSLGARRLAIARHVVFPAALPEIFTALRVSIGTAIGVLFLSESIAGNDGLGWFIVDAWGLINYPRMFAGILAMAILGVVLYEAADAAERWATRWKGTAR